MLLYIFLITGCVCAADGARSPFNVASDKDFYTALASPDIAQAEVVADIKLTEEVRSHCCPRRSPEATTWLTVSAAGQVALKCCCAQLLLLLIVLE